MKLSIIIVSFNVRKYLRQCLKSIFQSFGLMDIQVIIVDNYSKDKTCQMLEKEYPHVFLKKVDIEFKKYLMLIQMISSIQE